MADKIRVLIVDDLPETRENVRKLLQFESDLEVIGHAGTGDEALQLAKELRPDIVLMDINMPDADGIAASQTLIKSVPEAQVIIMSVQSEADYLQRAMLAGARYFLMKPFSGDELVSAVRRVYETRPLVTKPVASPQVSAERRGGQPRGASSTGKIVAVYSPKGGNGCTTVAINLAIALAEQGHRTLLVDGSLQFGDVAVMLNIKSVTSIIDVIERISELDQDLVSSVVSTHQSGLEVLLAPPRPEMAELVKEEEIKTLARSLRYGYDYVVIDTSSGLDDVTLALLDTADRIVLIARQDLPSLKNVSRFYDLSADLEYDADKVVLVVNHGSNKLNISVKDIVDTLKRPVAAVIPEDEIAYSAADRGRPLVSESWRNRPSAKALNELATKLAIQLEQESDGQEFEPNGTSRLARLFGR